MSTLTYEQFKGAVTERHLQLLTLAAHKQTISPATSAEGDEVRDALAVLLQYELLTIGREIWVGEGTGENYQIRRHFDAVIHPLAVAYMTQLAIDGLAALRAAEAPTGG